MDFIKPIVFIIGCICIYVGAYIGCTANYYLSHKNVAAYAGGKAVGIFSIMIGTGIILITIGIIQP